MENLGISPKIVRKRPILLEVVVAMDEEEVGVDEAALGEVVVDVVAEAIALTKTDNLLSLESLIPVLKMAGMKSGVVCMGIGRGVTLPMRPVTVRPAPSLLSKLHQATILPLPIPKEEEGTPQLVHNLVDQP